MLQTLALKNSEKFGRKVVFLALSLAETLGAYNFAPRLLASTVYIYIYVMLCYLHGLTSNVDLYA